MDALAKKESGIIREIEVDTIKALLQKLTERIERLEEK
jgi:hypothetical protein